MRPSRVEYYMGMAQHAAERSTCSRANVGAVLTNHNRVVGVGYNGGPSGKCHCKDKCIVVDEKGRCMLSIHAEINAILSREGQATPTDDLIMYCTHQPCHRCYVILVQYGVKRIYFDTIYFDSIRDELAKHLKIPIIPWKFAHMDWSMP